VTVAAPHTTQLVNRRITIVAAARSLVVIVTLNAIMLIRL
jgi:hypothetical protein